MRGDGVRVAQRLGGQGIGLVVEILGTRQFSVALGCGREITRTVKRSGSPVRGVEEFGGLGQDFVTEGIVMEELAREDLPESAGVPFAGKKVTLVQLHPFHTELFGSLLQQLDLSGLDCQGAAILMASSA